MPHKYWEDLSPGDTFYLGCHRIKQEEITEFSQRFQPQRSPDVGETTAMDNAITSDMHTLSLLMRPAVDGFLGGYAFLGSLCAHDIKVLQPLRSGDVMHGRAKVLEIRVSRSDPYRGIVRWQGFGTNQANELTVDVIFVDSIGRRPAHSRS